MVDVSIAVPYTDYIAHPNETYPTFLIDGKWYMRRDEPDDCFDGEVMSLSTGMPCNTDTERLYNAHLAMYAIVNPHKFILFTRNSKFYTKICTPASLYVTDAPKKNPRILDPDDIQLDLDLCESVGLTHYIPDETESETEPSPEDVRLAQIETEDELPPTDRVELLERRKLKKDKARARANLARIARNRLKNIRRVLARFRLTMRNVTDELAMYEQRVLNDFVAKFGPHEMEAEMADATQRAARQRIKTSARRFQPSDTRIFESMSNRRALADYAQRTTGVMRAPIPPEVLRDADLNIPLNLGLDSASGDFTAFWSEKLGETAIAAIATFAPFRYTVFKDGLDALQAQDLETYLDAAEKKLDGWFADNENERVHVLKTAGLRGAAIRAPHVARSAMEFLYKYRLHDVCFQKHITDDRGRTQENPEYWPTLVNKIVVATHKTLLAVITDRAVDPRAMLRSKQLAFKALKKAPAVLDKVDHIEARRRAELDGTHPDAHAERERIQTKYNSERTAFFREHVGPAAAALARSNAGKLVKTARARVSKRKEKQERSSKRDAKQARFDDMVAEMAEGVEEFMSEEATTSFMDTVGSFITENAVMFAGAALTAAAAMALYKRFDSWVNARIARVVEGVAEPANLLRTTLLRVATFAGILLLYMFLGPLAAVAASAILIAVQNLYPEWNFFPDKIAQLFTSTGFPTLASTIFAWGFTDEQVYRYVLRYFARMLRDALPSDTTEPHILLKQAPVWSFGYHPFNSVWNFVGTPNGIQYRLKRKYMPHIFRIQTLANSHPIVTGRALQMGFAIAMSGEGVFEEDPEYDSPSDVPHDIPRPDNPVEAELDFPDTSNWLTNFVETCAGVLGIDSVNATVATRIVRVALLGTLIKSTYASLASLFKETMGALIYTATGMHPFDSQLTQDCEVTNNLITAMSTTRAPLTPSDAATVCKLYDDVTVFMERAMQTRLSAGYVMAFRVFEPHQVAAYNMLKNPTIRVPPITCLFVGSGGAGKTTSIEAIIACVGRSYLGREVKASDKYYPSADAFKEGYYHNTFYIQDEFKSVHGTPETINRENNEFLIFNSTGAASMPMASLGATGKGNMFFVSPFVFYASNMEQATPESLGFLSGAAVARRISLLIEAVDTSSPNQVDWEYDICGGAYADPSNLRSVGLEPKPCQPHGLAPIVGSADHRTRIDFSSLCALILHLQKLAQLVPERMEPKESTHEAVKAATAVFASLKPGSFVYKTAPTTEKLKPNARARAKVRRVAQPDTEYDTPMEAEAAESHYDRVASVRMRYGKQTTFAERLKSMAAGLCKTLLYFLPVLIGGVCLAAKYADMYAESRDRPRGDDTRVRKPRVAKLDVRFQEAQSNASFPQMADRMMAVFKTQAVVEFDFSGTLHESFGTFFGPHTIVVPGHAAYESITRMRVRGFGDDPARTEWFMPREMVRIADRDLMLIHVTDAKGRDLPPRSTIGQYALDPESFEKHAFAGQRLGFASYDTRTRIIHTRGAIGIAVDEGDYKAGDKTIYSPRLLHYNATTGKGTCGSLIFAHVNGAAHVVGYHIAGGKSARGYAEIITRDVCDAILELADWEKGAVKSVDDAPEDATMFAESAGDYYGQQLKGIVEPKYRVKVGGKSKFSQSPLFEIFEPSAYDVAVLEPNERGDPYEIGMSKFSPTTNGSGEIPHRDKVKELFFHFYKPDEPRVIYTTQQSIVGDPLIGLPGLDMATSTGLPWSAGGVSHKTRYIHIDERPEGRIAFIHPDLQLALDKREAAARLGKRTRTIFAQRLKDELRSHEKVQKVATRLFDNGPVDFLILLRRYTLDFTQYCKITCASKPISLGINAHGSDWMELFGRLTRHNNNGADGDFANYDASIPPEVGLMAIELINEWYNDEHATLRATLLQELIHSHHVAGDKLFTTYGPHPSGDPITTLWNSICNFIVLVSSFFEVCKRTDSFNLFNPYKLQMALYGDDNIFVVAEKGFPYHMMSDVVYETTGMKLTAGDKSGPMKERPIYEMSYLSRAAVWRFGVLHGPLPIDVINSIIYWQKGDDVRNFQSRINSFFYELTHYPEHMYKRCYLKLVSHPFILEHNIDIPTYGMSMQRRQE